MQAYSDPKRESDPYALPDIEVFEMTAEEAAESSAYEDEQWQFLKRPEFKLATMNSRVRDQMLEAMIAELEITGGWFWWSCSPGCLPDGSPIGPFKTSKEALADARGLMGLSGWEVIVGNIGTVYSGDDEAVARRKFASYKRDSELECGRAVGESVVLMRDGEIVQEYVGSIEED